MSGNTGNNFWPSAPFGAVQIICVEAGTEIPGPFGRSMRVAKGKSVQRGGQLFMVQADYDAVKHKLKDTDDAE